MQINKIRISNILGIENLEFKAGQYTEISGKNGSGKTSIIESIKHALKGGNDVTLIRNGSDKGEIAIEFDNGMVLNKSLSNKSDLKLFDANGSKLSKPQSQLDMLYDVLSVNPVEFLVADKKSRARVLLESLPIELNDNELDAVKVGYAKELEFRNTGHALEILDSTYQAIYDERREVNRAIKEKSYAVNQLKESLVEIDFNEEEIKARIKELQEKQEDRLKKKEAFVEKINSDLQSKLAEIDRMRIEAMEKARVQKEELSKSFEEAFAPAREELTKLKEQLVYVGGATKTKELIAQYAQEQENMQTNVDELTTSLSKLEELKIDKLKNLPIKGLEIKEGEIFKDGVIFDRLNTAEQIKVAVEVAKLRAGELGLVCVDGLERFDSKTYDIFKKEMQKSGLQAIVTRVSNDEELTIS